MLKSLIRKWLELPGLESTLSDQQETLWDILGTLRNLQTHQENLLRASKAHDGQIQDHSSQIEDIVGGIVEASRQSELARAGQTECTGCGRVLPTYAATGGKCAKCA